MADVFQDFLVVIESADGTRRESLTPDEFRARTGCGKTRFLADCIEQWNKGQERQGYEDRCAAQAYEAPVTNGGDVIAAVRSAARAVEQMWGVAMRKIGIHDFQFDEHDLLDDIMSVP
jgi:hypothetical protein